MVTKEKVFQIRISEKELLEAKAKATKAGLGLAEFIRQLLKGVK